MNNVNRRYNLLTMQVTIPFIIVLLTFCVTQSVVYAQTISVLHNFYGNRCYYPASALIKGADGNFYGTTKCGGSTISSGSIGYGTIYKYDVAAGHYTVLHSFGDGSVINEGVNPNTSLIQAKDGNLYGTTYNGGSVGKGTIYKYDITTGIVTILHAFYDGSVVNDGSIPSSSLIQASDGNLYGTTYNGGTAGYGTIYKYDITTGIVTILHSFKDGSVAYDGSSPSSSLIQISDGNLYGTTEDGGSADYGTIYKYNVTTGSVTILHSFYDGSIFCDGCHPSGSLIQASDGNLYGTTSEGGSTKNTGRIGDYNDIYGFGTIFKYNMVSGSVTILHNFSDGSVVNDGANPHASLMQASDGNLYGTTYNGGPVSYSGSFSISYGTVYKYDIDGDNVTILHCFNDGSVTNDGYNPYASLIQGSDGNLYGTTYAGGGPNGTGTIFEYNQSTGAVTILPDRIDGQNPQSSLIQASNGNLYGTTFDGGSAGKGTIYKYDSATGDYTILHNFGDGSVTNDGARPYAAMIQASDGNLYGTTEYGGSAGYGTIFKYNIATGNINILHSFKDGSVTNDGNEPFTPLIQGSDGNLYGTTGDGGAANSGTIYKYDITSGQITILHSFNDGSVTNDGDCPYAAMIQASDGNLYGTTVYGGAQSSGFSYGTIYKYNITNGQVTILHSFIDRSVANTGIFPGSALIQGSDGNLYGTTEYGGSTIGSGSYSYGYGTIYKYNITTGIVTVLHSFSDGSISNDGANPRASLIQASDGNLYGTTVNGGLWMEVYSGIHYIYGYGTIYKYNITSGNLTTLHSFKDGSVISDGVNPCTALIQALDGYIYGTTPSGGQSVYGIIYKLNTSKTVLTSSVNPSIQGQLVTFNAVVTGNSPTGAVQFVIDGVNCGSPVALSSGTATYTKSDLSIGNHTITAVYSGDTNNIDSSSNTVTQTVLPLAITSLSPSSIPGATSFTLTVNGTAFVSGSIIKFNGTNMTTTYVSPTQLTAAINKYYTTLSSYPGSATVSVLNPDGKRSAGASIAITAPPAIPTITSLSPSTVSGAKTFTLTVNGSNFVSGSIIKWNGTNLTTTYMSATQLTASINKYYTTLSSYPGSATISILNPDGNRSTNATLTITAPLPAISLLSPASVQGATTFTLTVNGSNFVSGSIIKWNGTNLTTTFVSATQLTASINKYYTTLSSYPGSATVSVLNPDGGRSTGATISITQPVTPPTITSLSPSSVTGATTFTLTVNGAGFQSGAVIKWNGTNMTTTFVSSTQLTATIGKYYDTLTSYPGSATISVLNPDSGRSTGVSLAITSP